MFVINESREIKLLETIRHFFYAISLRTVLIALMSVAATKACELLGVVGEMPTSLIGLAVVFPLVFSINASFQRRDQALNEYGSINAHLASLLFAHKSWLKGAEVKDENEPNDLRPLILNFLKLMKDDLTNMSSTREMKADIYKTFSSISSKNEKFIDAGMFDTHSLVSSWLSEIMKSYEVLSNISDYRTPVALRAYSKVFLNMFPILFAPYFAVLNSEINFMGYLVAIIYSVVLVMLNNIQDNVENPFDNMGLDDIDLDKENRIRDI